jgi:subtilisin family serine protease
MLTHSCDEFQRFAVRLLFVLSLCLAGGLLLVTQAEAGGRNGQAARASQSGEKYVPGEVLVRMEAGVSVSSVNALAGSLGAAKYRDLKVSAVLPKGERILLFKSSALTGEALVKTALQSPDVAAASLNYARSLDAVTPNDPRFPELWGLNNTGQTGGTADADIDAPEAWSTTTGSSGVVVASIDTGVAYDHVDLAANMWHNPGEIPGNGIDDDGNGYIDDVYGIDTGYGDTDPYDVDQHGTHTSGTMAAVGNNGIGITGVAWQARIMALQSFASDGYIYDDDAITSINYVVNEKLNHGVNVVAINASWGGAGYNSLLRTAINAAGTAGIIFCAAAGNAGTDNDASPHYPSSYDCANIIAVAATDHNDALASFSQYGATSVDLAAPGVSILSTVPGGGVFVIDPSGPFYDTVESGINGWTAQSPWAITTEQSVSPTHAWSDSPSGNYANSTNVAITTPVIDLSATPGPDAFGFSVRYDLEAGYDYLYVEFSKEKWAL